MTSPLPRHPVTWRYRDHVQSIEDGRIPIGYPLEPYRYLASFPRYLAPKLRQRLLHDDVISGRHLGLNATGSRSNRSAIPENPTTGSNVTSIGRSVPEIWPFETLNLMTSLMTSQGPDQKFVKKNLFSLGRGPSCYNISLFRRKLPEKKYFEKNAWWRH